MSHFNVCITGSNRGIGLELCKHYAAAGARVIASCRQASEQLSALEVEIIEGVDVSATPSTELLQQRLSERLDGNALDILINNAGILISDRLESFDEQAIEEQFSVNALAPLRIARALKPLMNKPSKMVFVSSRMGSMGDNSSGGQYGYRMSKAALNAACRSLAIDVQTDAISVLCVHPGYVKTDMVKPNGEISPEQAAHNISARIEALNASTSGSFWHANGESLPW